jgi:hypothetical protein
MGKRVGQVYFHVTGGQRKSEGMGAPLLFYGSDPSLRSRVDGLG